MCTPSPSTQLLPLRRNPLTGVLTAEKSREIVCGLSHNPQGKVFLSEACLLRIDGRDHVRVMFRSRCAPWAGLVRHPNMHEKARHGKLAQKLGVGEYGVMTMWLSDGLHTRDTYIHRRERGRERGRKRETERHRDGEHTHMLSVCHLRTLLWSRRPLTSCLALTIFQTCILFSIQMVSRGLTWLTDIHTLCCGVYIFVLRMVFHTFCTELQPSRTNLYGRWLANLVSSLGVEIWKQFRPPPIRRLPAFHSEFPNPRRTPRPLPIVYV